MFFIIKDLNNFLLFYSKIMGEKQEPKKYSLIFARNVSINLQFDLGNYKIAMATFGAKFLDTMNKSKTHSRVVQARLL